MANAFIGAINLIIRGINLISPFKDINPLSTISLGRIGGPSAVSGGGAAREGGTGSITPALPTMPMLPPSIIGGGSGGGGGGSTRGGGGGGGGGIGGGGDLVTIQGALTTFGMAERIAAREAAPPVVINVTGGVSTSAEIGQSVYNALLQYKQVYGSKVRSFSFCCIDTIIVPAPNASIGCLRPRDTRMFVTLSVMS